MDERFRKLQRQYNQSGDPAALQQLMLEASRSSVFSQWYLRYLSLLDIQPGPQLAPLDREPARYPVKEGKLRQTLFNRFWWGQTPVPSDDVRNTPSPHGPGRSYFNAYRRLIGVLKRISEVGLQFMGRELEDSHPNRFLLLTPNQPSFPRLREIFQSLESFGPDNPPTMHQIEVMRVWSLDEFNRFHNLWEGANFFGGAAGTPLPESDDAVLSILIAILHQLYHTLSIFAQESTCVLCELHLSWETFRCDSPDRMRNFWTQITKHTPVLRTLDWNSIGMGPILSPYSDPPTQIRYLHKLQRQTHEFVIEEMFRQVELEILACDAVTWSPMILWN